MESLSPADSAGPGTEEFLPPCVSCLTPSHTLDTFLLTVGINKLSCRFWGFPWEQTWGLWDVFSNKTYAVATQGGGRPGVCVRGECGPCRRWSSPRAGVLWNVR